MPSDQLANLVSAFAHWRNNKKGVRTPTELREQAVALNSTYSASKITKALKVSGAQFKQWCQKSETVAVPAFVSLPEPIVALPLPSNVEVFFVSGDRLCLNGGGPAMLLSLVQALRA